MVDDEYGLELINSEALSDSGAILNFENTETKMDAFLSYMNKLTQMNYVVDNRDVTT